MTSGVVIKGLTCSLVALSSQNALLPAGLRQKDQTTKQPTGKFNRDSLLKYLEKEALEYKDREDIVPFTGEKKGLSWIYYLRLENINSLVIFNLMNSVNLQYFIACCDCLRHKHTAVIVSLLSAAIINAYVLLRNTPQ